MELSAVARPTRARRHDSIGRRMTLSVNTEANQQTSLTLLPLLSLHFQRLFTDSKSIPYHNIAVAAAILTHDLYYYYSQYPRVNKNCKKRKMASQALLTPSPLLKPLVTLAGWTFVMELWMYATRIPAISNYKLSTDPAKISEELQTKIPIHIRQVADKYAIKVPFPSAFELCIYIYIYICPSYAE